MKPKPNLWPYALIMTFVIFISATAGLIVMAATHRDNLVSDNYYEQEIKYQSRIDSADRARQLPQAKAAYDAAQRRIVISLPPSHAGKKISGQIDLYRPSAAQLDRQFKLEPDATGHQVLDAAALSKGLWKVRVSWTVEGQDYFMEQKIVIPAGA
jgi:hypothetical protein